jgi:hypothetical protein
LASDGRRVLSLTTNLRSTLVCSVSIHEKVHEAPIVHEATTLPTISHADFLKKQQSEKAHTHQDAGHHHQFCKLFVTLAMQPYIGASWTFSWTA